MAKRKKEWPEWWTWDLELSGHMQKRFLTRHFTQVDLRRMMEHATNFRKDHIEGRWIIETRFRQTAWHVIVEPLADETKLEVITAYEVTDD